MANRECVCSNLCFSDHPCQPGRCPFPTDEQTKAQSKETALAIHCPLPEGQTLMRCTPTWACTWTYPPRSMHSLKAGRFEKDLTLRFPQEGRAAPSRPWLSPCIHSPSRLGPNFMVSGPGILAGLLQGGQQLLCGLEVPCTQRGHQEVSIIEQQDVVSGVLLGHR